MLETSCKYSEQLTTSITLTSFWVSVDILLKKPHVLNKKLWGSKMLVKLSCKPQFKEWGLPMKYRPLENLDLNAYKLQLLEDLQLEECLETQDTIEIVLIELLPKTFNHTHAFQLVFLDKQSTSVTFFDVTPESGNQKIVPNFTYRFRLDNNHLILGSDSKYNASKSYNWLQTTVLPQLVKWGEESIHKSNESLALVCSNKYYQRYNELKLKYGKEMVKIWPECTDPSKFVYEDVAIATYLLLLWEDERDCFNLQTPQTFVDLGCGNGLLVYILAKEGHKGVGIDVRKRQIWDMYGNDIQLEERTITPSDSHLFPETDWLIGNHSDELTPWVPVIAARSSYKCNFFLLPCCAYNFNGTKYQRQNSSISQYTEYLQHIKQLCENCGFKTDTDRLKIPSTKRICLVGRGRTYTEEEYDIYCNQIKEIISSENNAAQIVQQDEPWLKDFKAREAAEKVRNCTQIDKDLVISIVKQITSYLLEDCTDSHWTVGKTVEINEVVQLIPQDKLKELKSECGGLQTLMKNNHHIFKVQSGKVQLRYPKTVDEVNNNIKNSKASKIRVQQKPCWFYNNHPQGCPLEDAKCSFLHIQS